MQIKKYFLFDNEPVTGGNFFWRSAIGLMTFGFGIGIWLIVATAYKRSGTFYWTKSTRIISSVLMPFALIAVVTLSSEDGSLVYKSIAFPLILLYAIFWLKRGYSDND